MSNQIIPRDPNFARLRTAMQVEDPRSGIRFPTIVSDASGLADTYIIAHYDGEGASTLALFLSLFAPIRVISPNSSAIGMNSEGGMSPRSSQCHRTRASAPVKIPDWASRIG